MNRFSNCFKPRIWILVLAIAALVGCGGNGVDGGIGAGKRGVGGNGPAPVNLGASGNFVILAKSGITNVPISVVTGDIGVSPITASAITGFSLTLDSTGLFSTSSQVVGKAYAADYSSPTPGGLTIAVSDMEAAYTDTAGRPTPNFIDAHSGDISGQTLIPGLYKWSTGLLIASNVTLNGGPNDVWIFQVAGGITQAAGTRVLLTGGALPQNIFWATADTVALGATAHLEGIVLSKKEITLASGASANGRLLSQTAVTLDSNTITQPRPSDDTSGNDNSSDDDDDASDDDASSGDDDDASDDDASSGDDDDASDDDDSSGGNGTVDTTAPILSSSSPVEQATGVYINGNIVAVFNEAINPASVNAITFTLTQGGTPVPGVVTYAGNVATFNPTNNLAANTEFAAMLNSGITDLAGNPFAAMRWCFITGAATGTGQAAGPSAINIGAAGHFVILAKSGISNVPTSLVTGDIGVSPIAATAITGFSLILDSTGTFSTSSQVNGKVYAADYSSPTPTHMTMAISNMEAAYTEAANRTAPDFTELHSGDISGQTLVPGLYKWSTGVLISSNVTLNGGPNDVWIFQISGGITQVSATSVLLTGGALPQNIFWQSAGKVALNTAAHMEGIVLAKKEITLEAGATVNGRLLAQKAVTLNTSTVMQP